MKSKPNKTKRPKPVVNVLKDQIDAVVKVIDGGLRALTPTLGTAREVSDEARQACKLGLRVLKLTLKSLDSLCVCHNGSGVVLRSNEKALP